MPAADDSSSLRRREGAAGDSFRVIMEEGHYAGRVKPTNTRQGIYAATPTGAFLASINTRDAKRMRGMLEEALSRWRDLPREERLLPDGAPVEAAPTQWDARYPDGGLVLSVVARDLPRPLSRDGDRRRERAWNLDHAWFRPEEARSMLPETLEVGAKADVPEALIRRLARLHLVDFVRGQTSAYRDENVEEARMGTEVVAVADGVVRVRLTGATRVEVGGEWSIRDRFDADSPSAQKRGYEGELLGFASWHVEAGHFVAFELLSLGTRWGGTQYNSRSDDLEPGPMGFSLTLADDDARVMPARLWGYDW